MSIMDALDRAKRLRTARTQESQTSDDSSGSPRLEGHPFVQPSPVILAVQPETHFETLRTVPISMADCEQHRIITSACEQQEMVRADAAFRLLRSKVQQRLKRGGWSALAITSPNAGDGKTVTTLNLAISIAREKQRPVYVIDLDLRNPSVCKYLGIQDFRSLSEYFTGDAEASDVLMQTSIPNLVVAGAAAGVTGASEMLAGPRLDELLAHIYARSPNCIILIDLPPVNLTDEALIVAPRVHALLVVVAERKTEREDLARALNALNDFTIAGIVVSRSGDTDSGRSEYYSE